MYLHNNYKFRDIIKSSLVYPLANRLEWVRYVYKPALFFNGSDGSLSGQPSRNGFCQVESDDISLKTGYFFPYDNPIAELLMQTAGSVQGVVICYCHYVQYLSVQNLDILFNPDTAVW
jgi:hypothetical protein